MRTRVAATVAASALLLVAVAVPVVFLAVDALVADQATTGLRSQAQTLAAVVGADASAVPAAWSALPAGTIGQLLDEAGAVRSASPGAPPEPVLDTARLPGPGGTVTGEVRAPRPAADPELLAYAAVDSAGGVVVLATSREDLADRPQQLAVLVAAGALLVVAAAAAGGAAAAGLALRPVERMRRAAAGVSASNPWVRLPVPDAEDELRRLAVTLNDLLDRLQRSLERERRFVAEASHELRTPLAMVRLELDLAQRPGRTRQELADTVAAAQADLARLTELADDLLLVAGESAEPERVDVDLAEVAADALARLLPGFAAAGRRARVTATSPAMVLGDPATLRRAVVNLVDNALRHGSGDVLVDVVPADGEVEVRVRDAGAQRTPARPGGLGLSITAAIVEAHGGRLTGPRPEPGGGTCAGFALPAAPASRGHGPRQAAPGEAPAGGTTGEPAAGAT